MKKISIILIGVIALMAPTVVQAASPVTIRPSDLNTAETRSAGHVEFLRNGIHVYTDDATGNAKAAGYFAVPAQPLPSSALLTWTGTQPQPGGQIVFDTDGDRANANSYNILVFEPVYGNDVWMTGGSARATQRGITCPSTTGGSGSDCHGTLAEWATANPTFEMYAGGFSLGSGVKGDGVIERVQYGSTVYEFTNLPVAQDGAQGPQGNTGPQGAQATATVADAVGSYSVVRVKHGVRVTLRTDAVANATTGKSVRWIVKADKKRVATATQALGASDSVVVRFPKKSGGHTVTIKKNSTVVKVVTVKTGR